MNKMTEAQKGWLAGIIDGEGSIFVMAQGRTDRERTINYILKMSVQSTDMLMAPKCFELTQEGSCFLNKETRPNMSDTLKWQVHGKGAVRILKEILPYMVVKQQQAKLAIEFQELTKKHWRNMTEEDYALQEKIYHDMKSLKQTLKIGKASEKLQWLEKAKAYLENAA